MSDAEVPPPESDLRRRAAWLLGMLALVAVLIAVLMITFLGGPGPKKTAVGPGVDDTATPPPLTSSQPTKPRHDQHTTQSSSSAGVPSSGTSGSTTTGGSASCPTSAPCTVSTDIGNAVGAVNALRAQMHLTPVTGTLSQAALACALSNGAHCTGAWAETYLNTPDGAAAIAKIPDHQELLSPTLKSIEYGWAYSPTAKMYYLAVIRDS